ncbi:MAG: YbaK/EbsC family protein [Comamonas sp.]
MCGAEIFSLPEGVQRVARFLQDAGHAHAPQMLDGAARTAQEAAEQLGIVVGQVAKSVVFKHKESGGHVLVVAAGDRRVDEKKVAALVGKIGRADADFVKSQTGFSIGGVSPVAHLHKPVTLIDSSLSRFEVLWAAAGHPHAVFPLSLQELQSLTQAPVVDVAQAPLVDAA